MIVQKCVYQKTNPDKYYYKLTNVEVEKIMAKGKYGGDNSKRTSMGAFRNSTKTSSMNKNKRANTKKYRGQGR